MSELGAETMRGISWPSNGLSEVPFRLYTDPEQYRLEQERIFKGPAWSFLCLATEIPNAGDYVATTIGETAVVVTRDTDGGVTPAQWTVAAQPDMGQGRDSTPEMPFSEERIAQLESTVAELRRQVTALEQKIDSLFG